MCYLVQVFAELVKGLWETPSTSGVGMSEDPGPESRARKDMAQKGSQQRAAYVMCTSGSTGAPQYVLGTLEGPELSCMLSPCAHRAHPILASKAAQTLPGRPPSCFASTICACSFRSGL